MKTALVYAADERALEKNLPLFFADKNYLDYEVLALLTDKPSGNSLRIAGTKFFRHKFPATLDVLNPKVVNKFVYRFIDALFFFGEVNLNAAIPLFLGSGVEPRKIILWNEQGTVEPLSFGQRDGTQVVCFEGLEFHIKNPVDERFMRQTLARLKNQKFLHNQPRERYADFVKNLYRQWMGRELDLDNPKTFTEKINWLKLYDSTPLKARLADKFAVRDYVADKIGDDKLKPLLGAWDSFDEINFDKLPDRFVLKCNHGSGMNIIVKDKNSLDMQQAREKINAWLTVDYGAGFFELHYSPIKRKIIAEKYFEQLHGGLIDYKFHCFNGEPKVISVIGGRDPIRHTCFQEYHDFDWKDLGDWNFGDYNPFPNPLSKPARLEDMVHFAKILSKNFSYVRVDFYEIEGQIYFGEMTFMPDAGFIPYKRTWTYERDLEIGNMIKL
ncbi:MAG: hypothetical protein II902_01690 [Selenomonadaceae bacterium]|nr:hypothetical protein [Selenomonadaceae bacterium]